MNRVLFQMAIVFSLVVTNGSAQVPDSLRGSLDSARRLLPGLSGKARYDLTFKIAYDLFDVDNPKAVKYAEEAFELAQDLGDSATIVRSGRIFGQLLWRVGSLRKSIDLMERMLAMADRCGFEKDVRFLSNSLSIAYTYRGQYDKALQHSYRSLELRQLTRNKTEISIAENNIGTTFYTIGIYDQAAGFLKRSLAIDSLNLYTPDRKIGLALCYTYLNYLSQSRDLINSVVLEYKGKLTTHSLTRISLGLGMIEMRERNFRAAENHLLSGYELAAADSNKTFMSDCLIALGQVYFATGQITMSEKKLLDAEFLSNQSGYRNGIEGANIGLAKIYAAKKDFAKASAAKSKILAAKDSSMNQNVIENIYRLQFDFYQKENQKKIATQAELLILQDRAIKHAMMLNVVTAICAGLLVAVILLLYRSNRLKRQIALELEQKVHERTSELKVSVRSLQSAELERNFMLDGIARRLNASVATFKGLSHIATSYKGVPNEFTDGLDNASDTLTSIIQQIIRSKRSL